MNKSVVFALLFQCAAPCAGVLLGGWLLVVLLLPALGLGEVDRIRQLGDHIRTTAALPQQERDAAWADAAARRTVLLGDSITREGVDADILTDIWSNVAQQPATFENWAVSGCSLVEQRIQLSKVLDSNPEAIVFALGPTTLSHLQDLPLDKAFAYAYGGFGAADWGRTLPQEAGLSEASLAALASPRWRQQLHFRTAPKSWLNQQLRSFVKGGSGANVANDWRTPHYMTGNVGPDQLAWHVRLMRSSWTKDRSEHVATGETLLRQLAQETRAAKVGCVFVLSPVHPQLQSSAALGWRQTRPAIERVARANRATIIDATSALSVDDFADALHPNQSGRARYSRFLASGLQTPILTARR